MVRDLFGSILYASLQRKIDMAEILKYPLTPIPLSLCHVDGTMQSTKKSVLIKELESRIKTDDPPYIDASIIDGMFFLHLLVELPGTFRLISKHIFKRLCKVSKYMLSSIRYSPLPSKMCKKQKNDRR